MTKAGNVGPDPRLFLDLGDSISFEQSMRNFYSTPNTTVGGDDQTAFAKYLVWRICRPVKKAMNSNV